MEGVMAFLYRIWLFYTEYSTQLRSFVGRTQLLMTHGRFGCSSDDDT